VPVKRLNQQVNRNRRRFPLGFIFQLSAKESEDLRLQNATSSSKHGGRRYRPYAFTEHGAIMAATVLNSPRAVKMSVSVVRAFVHFRQLVVNNSELAAKLNEIEFRLKTHDGAISEIIAALENSWFQNQVPVSAWGSNYRPESSARQFRNAASIC
jgi:hypothetical protein